MENFACGGISILLSWLLEEKKWWNFAVSLQCKCDAGMALPQLKTRQEFFQQSWHLFFRLLFLTIMASSLTSGCADAFSTHIWNGWRKRSYLLKDFSQPVAIWRRYVTGRDGWEIGTVVYFWLHDPCLCLPPGPLYGLHTKRKTSHNGSTQAAYKAGQVINGVRGPVGNELGTSFSRMMQNNTREGCSQMQDNQCYERPTTWLV